MLRGFVSKPRVTHFQEREARVCPFLLSDIVCASVLPFRYVWYVVRTGV